MWEPRTPNSDFNHRVVSSSSWLVEPVHCFHLPRAQDDRMWASRDIAPRSYAEIRHFGRFRQIRPENPNSAPFELVQLYRRGYRKYIYILLVPRLYNCACLRSARPKRKRGSSLSPLAFQRVSAAARSGRARCLLHGSLAGRCCALLRHRCSHRAPHDACASRAVRAKM